MATLFRARPANKPKEEELGGQMSFLEHLDELRTRLMWSIVFVIVASMGCWFLSDRIYRFLAIPVEQALANAQRRQAPIAGRTGSEAIITLDSLKEGDAGRYVFIEETKLGTAVIPAGASVMPQRTGAGAAALPAAARPAPPPAGGAPVLPR